MIQPKGNLIEQRHRVDGGMEGVEHQVAGLGHHHRGQHQSQLTGFAEPAATEGCARAAVGNGIPARGEIAGIGAGDQPGFIRHGIGAEHERSGEHAVEVHHQLQHGDFRGEPQVDRWLAGRIPSLPIAGGAKSGEIGGIARLAQPPFLDHTGAPCSIACRSRRTWAASIAVRQCCNGDT